MNPSYIVPLSVEYIEYAVKNLEQAASLYEKMGFARAGQRTEATRRSWLLTQGDIRIILTASDSDKDPAFHFHRVHGEGVINMGLRVENAEDAFRLARQKGAKEAHGLETVRGRENIVQQRGAIQVYGDIRHTFVSYASGGRLEDLFAENYNPSTSIKGRFLQTVDHVTVNLERGQVDRWAKYYTDMFGMTEVRYFDIHTDRTGLFSRAMRTPNGRLTMPFNEATEDKSQIQEFIDTFHGPGIQHLALHTSNIILCLKEYMSKGFEFLTVPRTYYDDVPKRVPGVTEDMNELMNLGILVDGSAKGYLLQIFTQPVVGPFFFEFIQRKGDQGFGEGNFKALFEAIERDQIRRGVL